MEGVCCLNRIRICDQWIWLENAIFVSGESDGKFNKEDFILFYAEGADKSVYQASRNAFEYQNNLYSDNNYYFLTVSDAAGKRIETSEDLGEGFPQIDSYTDYAVHELDQINELSSGREWFGEKFGVTRELTLPFNIPGIRDDTEMNLISAVVGQSYTNASFQIFFNNVLLVDLIPGKHKMIIKAWDVFNNSAEASIDFIVTDGEALVIESFGNYPNPFSNRTTLFFYTQQVR